MPMSVRVRFAPSPTGFLHVGNVRTALFNWLFARQQGGAFILRIEDTDAERSEQRFETQLMEDLKWLGLDWDESVDIGGSFGPYRQTDRFHLYKEAATKLVKEGKAYHCFCTEEQLDADRQHQQEAGQTIQYVGRCREIPVEEAAERIRAGEEATVRLKVRPGRTEFNDLVFGPISVETSTIGDFILLRSDGSAQYNFAVVIDDALMRISHVIRGEGHISNTHRQILLYESLGYETPAFAHLSTILGPDGSKLSKRHGATSIAEFRELGYLPEAVVNYLALLGWPPPEDGREILTVREIVSEFNLGRVNVSPATFDTTKLDWVNRTHLKSLGAEELIRVAAPYLAQYGVLPAEPDAETLEWAGQVSAILVNYIDKLTDLERESSVISDFNPERDLQDEAVREVLAEDGAVAVIKTFTCALEDADSPEVTFEVYKDAVMKTKSETGAKGKGLFRPIRVAITAKSSGPELEKIIPVLEWGSRLSLPTSIVGVKERARRVSDCL